VIELRDTVFVRRPPADVWAWLSDLPVHYRQWHPAHIRCRYERGSRLEAGSVLRVTEVLHGRRHVLRLRATEVVPNRRLRYAGRLFRGAFELEEAGGGTLFTAELSFGVDVPLVGRAIDGILARALASRLGAMREHMHEEGRNLKRLLEGEAP
jgi:uncharacterized protein YndB with AHSA1/START domain